MRPLVVISTLLISSLAFADDAFWSEVGSPGNFGKSRDIRMVSEEVNISLKRESMHVRAAFSFQNDGDAQTVTTAFPDSITDVGHRQDKDPYSITAFKAWVDDKPVAVSRKTLPRESNHYSAVWLKKVPFEAHGKRTVVCEYEATYPSDLGFYWGYYILQTGATWKGDIGDCKVHIDWSDITDRGRPSFVKAGKPLYDSHHEMKPARESWTSADFEYKHIEPDFDIAIRVMNAFWNFRVNGKRPLELPISESGDAMIHGSASDPSIEMLAIPMLFGTKRDIDQAYKDHDAAADYSLTAVTVRGHDIGVKSSKLLVVDGKRIRLRRKVAPNDPHIRVRDIVAGLGGTYRYDARAKRVDIQVPR